MKEPNISVVVCTRNRGLVLTSCLAALEKQTLLSSDYEVIIVDNGSTDETPSLASTFCDRNKNFRYVSEGRPGLSIARNRGVRESAASFVAFTDDDAEAELSWLERLVEAFGRLPSDTGIVGGDVIPVWEIERPFWLNDALLRPLSAGLKWSIEPRFLRKDEWLVEVNSAYRKSALEKVEGFPEHLGRLGDTLLSGDGAANVLIQRAGYRLYYDPRILVRHRIPASRATKSWFRRRSFWQGATMNLLHRYVDQTTQRLGFAKEETGARMWEEISVPTSTTAWADLFEDETENFGQKLYQLEQLGYLLESQSVVVGR